MRSRSRLRRTPPPTDTRLRSNAAATRAAWSSRQTYDDTGEISATLSSVHSGARHIAGRRSGQRIGRAHRLGDGVHRLDHSLAFSALAHMAPKPPCLHGAELGVEGRGGELPGRLAVWRRE